ncbi:MAG: hypothetical protein ACRDEA_02400 [Microcystaceae cyanobacterium]
MSLQRITGQEALNAKTPSSIAWQARWTTISLWLLSPVLCFDPKGGIALREEKY